MADEKIPFTDVMVFVPGLMGSVLERAGTVLWSSEVSSLFRVLYTRAQSIRSLTLPRDSPTDDDIGDGVVATRVIPDVHMIPGLWKIDGYTRVCDYMRRRLTVTEGENFFQFPYDWRRDCRYNARRLQRAANEWLHRWRTRTGNPSAQLVILGHSMGGIISRYFLECLGGWVDTRRLITFGTPYRGAVAALTALANDFSFKLGPLRVEVSSFVRAATSAYQLLPIWTCYDHGDGALLRIGETSGIPNLDPDRAAASLAFFREIHAAVATNRRDPRWAEHGYRVHPIVGTRHRTFVAARRDGDRVEALNTIQGGEIDGDGTVSRVSAVPVELSNAGAEVFVAAKHASMQNTDPALHHVEGLFSSQRINQAFFFGDDAVELALELEDLFTTDEPVSITLDADDDPGRVTVTIESVQSGETVASRELEGSALADAIEFEGLPEGSYRVRVRPHEQGVNAPSDLFMVLDPSAAAS